MTQAVAAIVEERDALREEVRQLRKVLSGEQNQTAWELGLSKTEMALFSQLERTQYATHQTLLDVVHLLNGNNSTHDTLKTQICKMRAKIKGAGYRIRTTWGVGYSLEKVQ